MRITLNGAAASREEGETVARLVASSVEGDPSRGVAVAVNGEVLPKKVWDETVLSEDDRVEILRAIGGG